MAIAADLAAILVIGMTVLACSPVISNHTAAAEITMPGTTAVAASDLSLESATPGVPARRLFRHSADRPALRCLSACRGFAKQRRQHL